MKSKMWGSTFPCLLLLFHLAKAESITSHSHLEIHHESNQQQPQVRHSASTNPLLYAEILQKGLLCASITYAVADVNIAHLPS